MTTHTWMKFAVLSSYNNLEFNHEERSKHAPRCYFIHLGYFVDYSTTQHFSLFVGNLGWSGLLQQTKSSHSSNTFYHFCLLYFCQISPFRSPNLDEQSQANTNKLHLEVTVLKTYLYLVFPNLAPYKSWPHWKFPIKQAFLKNYVKILFLKFRFL